MGSASAKAAQSSLRRNRASSCSPASRPSKPGYRQSEVRDRSLLPRIARRNRARQELTDVLVNIRYEAFVDRDAYEQRRHTLGRRGDIVRTRGVIWIKRGVQYKASMPYDDKAMDSEFALVHELQHVGEYPSRGPGFRVSL